MFEYGAEHFTDLCRSGVVRERIAALAEDRSRAVRNFWLYLVGAVVLAGVTAALLWQAGLQTIALVAAFAILVGGIILAFLPLSKTGEGLKHHVLGELARTGGMEFLPAGFDPPVYPEASRTLFGSWLTGQVFTDLFHGTDTDGQRFALYEALLTRRAGKSTETVFNGQVYAFQRRRKAGGTIAIVPDRGLFNFFKPAKGMERVKFDGDPAFEKKFEVYATHPSEALGLLGTDVRQLLLDLRNAGRVFAFSGPEDMLVAVWGKNRFEAGSMFKSLSGEQRVRRMFDELCESLGVLRKLKRALD
jgi:hypothetical protein